MIVSGRKIHPLSYVKQAEVPQLHVGGYYDQEDLNGPQLMYGHMEKMDKQNINHLVLGPWYHGQWGRSKGDSIGLISLGSSTGDAFRLLQKKWFDYYLKDIGDGKFEEAYAFQTGSNVWKTYTSWPPRQAVIRPLYAGPRNQRDSQNLRQAGLYPISVIRKNRFLTEPCLLKQLMDRAVAGGPGRWKISVLFIQDLM